MKKQQIKCNQKTELLAEYEVAELKCGLPYGHKGPHKTKICKDQFIYWSEGTV